jgi:hypothetical protein
MRHAARRVWSKTYRSGAYLNTPRPLPKGYRDTLEIGTVLTTGPMGVSLAVPYRSPSA